MKYFLLVSIICFSGVIGKLFSKVYVYRDLFFKEIINMCLFIKNKIKFGLVKIEDILNDYIQICDKRFINEFNEIKNHIIKKRKNNELFIKNDLFWYLSNEEKLMFEKFFINIGEFDLELESKNVDEFLNYIKAVSLDVSEKRRKKEEVVLKLSLLVGVGVCILII